MIAVDSPKLQPFVGAGVGLHFVSAEVTIPDFFGGPPMTVEDSSTELGIDFGGGASMPLSPKTDLSGEFWYSIVDQFDQVALKLGVAFKLGS
jgi:opacity protein-like surface antigen